MSVEAATLSDGTVSTLDYIEVAESKHRPHRTLDKLALKLIERKVVAYISTFVQNPFCVST